MCCVGMVLTGLDDDQESLKQHFIERFVEEET